VDKRLTLLIPGEEAFFFPPMEWGRSHFLCDFQGIGERGKRKRRERESWRLQWWLTGCSRHLGRAVLSGLRAPLCSQSESLRKDDLWFPHNVDMKHQGREVLCLHRCASWNCIFQVTQIHTFFWLMTKSTKNFLLF
jgi:hypothetical protein